MASLNVIYRIIKVFLIQDVQGFLLQLLEALSFAHERNIAHLDIKVRMVPKDFNQYRRNTDFKAYFIRLKSAIKLIVIKLERKFRLDLE